MDFNQTRMDKLLDGKILVIITLFSRPLQPFEMSNFDQNRVSL